MKKIVITLLLLVSFAGARAQMGSDFGVNMFMHIGAGVGFNQANGQQSPIGFASGIGVGKWILNPFAFRISLDFQNNPSIGNPNLVTSFASATATFLWDFNATFSRVRNWRVNAYPMIGLGLFYQVPNAQYGTDHEFHTMLGLHVPVRISAGWDLFFEYKYYTTSFDNLHAGTCGITRRFSETPFHRRTEFESRSTDEDWFIGAGMGVNYSAFELFTNPHPGGAEMMGVAPEIMFGRNFSNFWTIRIKLSGLTAHEQYDTIAEEAGDSYVFVMLHADFMFNLMHAFDFTRGVRLSILPYVGAGPIWRFDNPKFVMAADWGFMFRYYINRHSDIYADVNYVMMPPRVGGGVGPQHDIFGIGIASVTVGYIYNFGQSSARYRMPLNTCPSDM